MLRILQNFFSRSFIISGFLCALVPFASTVADDTELPRAVSPVCKIHRISSMGVNVYLVETVNDLYLIDAGYAGMEKMIERRIGKIKNKKLRLIFLTHGHFDHYGTARAIKTKTGALIGIHQYDAEALMRGATPIDSVRGIGTGGVALLPLAEEILNVRSVCPDVLFDDGDTLARYGLAARVVLLPGHSRGHSCLLVQDTIAFTGDLILTHAGLEKQNLFANSWTEIDSSIMKLKKINPSILYTGHFKTKLTRRELEKIR